MPHVFCFQGLSVGAPEGISRRVTSGATMVLRMRRLGFLAMLNPHPGSNVISDNQNEEILEMFWVLCRPPRATMGNTLGYPPRGFSPSTPQWGSPEVCPPRGTPWGKPPGHAPRGPYLGGYPQGVSQGVPLEGPRAPWWILSADLLGGSDPSMGYFQRVPPGDPRVV